MFEHKSVMPNEVLEYLKVQEGLVYFDGTLGGGGHTRQILEKLNGTGHLYSFDQDKNVVEKQSEELKDFKNFTAVHANFSEIPEYCKENEIKITGGLLMDLGLSSIQLDDPDRGFSFLKNGPLDMRMNQDSELSAEDVVNTFSEKDIADIIYKYGEERFSRQIARVIVDNRPISTTNELADLVKKAYAYKTKKREKIHPATRTFQGLRIYVNSELDVLESVLENVQEYLESEARIVVLTFHSLEDRIVKWFFKENGFKILTKKPLLASEQELEDNIRSRSAKLRAAEFIKE